MQHAHRLVGGIGCGSAGQRGFRLPESLGGTPGVLFVRAFAQVVGEVLAVEGLSFQHAGVSFGLGIGRSRGHGARGGGCVLVLFHLHLHARSRFETGE